MMEVADNATVVTCESCGTTQTIAKLDNEKKINLLNRANALRIRSNFDKALSTYELIVADFPKEAEAHWGI